MAPPSPSAAAEGEEAWNLGRGGGAEEGAAAALTSRAASGAPAPVAAPDDERMKGLPPSAAAAGEAPKAFLAGVPSLPPPNDAAIALSISSLALSSALTLSASAGTRW